MSTPAYNRRAGIEPNGRVSITPPPPPRQSGVLTSPLTDQFPERVSLKFGAINIYIPASKFSVPTGQCAWYGLRSLAFDQIGPHLWTGYRVSMFPPDVAAGAYGRAGWAGAVAWGDVLGERVCLVIGKNLNGGRITEGAWCPGPCDFPLLKTAAAVPATDTLFPARVPDDLVYVRFPASQPSTAGTVDVSYNLREPAINEAPFAVRCTQGDKLQAALVFAKEQWDSVLTASGFIATAITGELELSRVYQRSEFTQ